MKFENLLLVTVVIAVTVIAVFAKGDGNNYGCTLSDVNNNNCHSEYKVRHTPKLERSIDCNENDVIIKWKTHKDIEIKKFTIAYNTSINSTWHKISLPPTDSSFKMQNLTPGINYTFQINATEKDETTLQEIVSPIKTCVVSSSVPFKNPNFNVSPKGEKEETVLVSWEPLSVADHNGRGFMYQVLWKPTVQSSSWNVHDVKNNCDSNCSIDIKTDAQYSNYVFSVRTANEKGVSNASLTEKSIYKLEILDLQCSNPANLRWKYYDEGIPISEFSVKYCQQMSAGENKTISLPGIKSTSGGISQLTYGLELVPGFNYTFQLLATTEAGAIIFSPQKSCSMPYDIPYKSPSNLKLEANKTLENNVLVSWDPLPVIDYNGPEFKYQVLWRPNIENVTTWNEPLNVTQDCLDVCSVVVNVDEKYSAYVFKVRTANKIGLSNSTSPPKTISLDDKGNENFLVRTIKQTKDLFIKYMWQSLAIISIVVLVILITTVLCIRRSLKRRRRDEYDLQSMKNYKPQDETEPNCEATKFRTGNAQNQTDKEEENFL